MERQEVDGDKTEGEALEGRERGGGGRGGKMITHSHRSHGGSQDLEWRGMR